MLTDFSEDNADSMLGTANKAGLNCKCINTELGKWEMLSDTIL